jgi:probable HAF family extracellular repeat protein
VKRNIAVVMCLGMLFAASTCFGQMYTVKDLGLLGGYYGWATGINASGQVIGTSDARVEDERGWAYHGFRTAPNSTIRPWNNLGIYLDIYTNSYATGINASGQVVGYWDLKLDTPYIAFRTAPNSAINPATDDLGTLGDPQYNRAYGINASGQVVGFSSDGVNFRAFRTAPNSPINPATDDLGTLGGGGSEASGINDSGQVVGDSDTSDGHSHAFRTAANSPINPATDDLGTLGGEYSWASGINASGQVIGDSETSGHYHHAFRTAPNSAINPATDDLGTLGGTYSRAAGINASGQVVGDSTTSAGAHHAFLYKGGVMYDLNNFIRADSGWVLQEAVGINDKGQIAGNGINPNGIHHPFLLTPVKVALGFVSPTSLAFGKQAVNTTSASKRISLLNKGEARMTIREFLITGDFQIQTNYCMNGVQPGTHCDLYITFTPTLAGPRGGTLTFVGNAWNSPQSASLSGVGTVTTTTSLISSRNPSTYGQSVTLTAQVIPTIGLGTPSGKVTFYAGTVALGTATLNQRVASLTTSALPAGVQSLTASYGGDPLYVTSTSSALPQTVNQATSTISLLSALNPSFVGEAVTLKATVTGQYGGAASGTVMFKQGTTVLATVPVANSSAIYNNTFPQRGTFGMSAVYSGDNNLKTSTSKPVWQVVRRYSTTTSITSASNPSVYGQAVTLTAKVESGAPGGPTGKVTFKNGTTVLGTATLSAGTAILMTKKLPVGTLSIMASYNGDAQSATSTSAVLLQTVHAAVTSTTITSSLNPSAQGQTVTFTAKVTSPTTIPTGTVTFKDGGTVLAPVNLVAGKASYSTSTLSAGSHSVTAVYSGTANITGNTSAILVQTVN